MKLYTHIPTLLLILTFSAAFGQVKVKDKNKEQKIWDSLNKPTTLIRDIEDIYTPDQERFLLEIIEDYKKRNGIEIIIVSEANAAKFDALTLKGAYDWPSAVAEGNGILLSISKALHRMRIQNGDNIKGKLTDAETRLIIDAFCIPKFKNNDYYQGTLDGIIEIVKQLR
jgi:uncharacterized protein